MLAGTGLEYFFSFDVPEGIRSLFLTVKILYSDEPDAMLTFYATRNLLWTKRTPSNTAPETSQSLPIIEKDADTSSHLGFEVTNLLVRSP